MTIISYAQNCEDIMLWRALKNVKEGFYIDIGAAWPEYDSITKLFYDQGWHGLNVEPNPELFEKLKNDRPRDTNLCLAVSDRSGVQVMNFLSNQGLSTLDEEIAKVHIDAGWLCHRKKIKVNTLKDIWKLNIPAGAEVHFLKIDVEGYEKAVLEGHDWSNLRPWIVLLESTIPMSQTENYQEWEPILVEAGYLFAYTDGINRFYVAKEHSELLSFLDHPPNYFDDFIPKSIKQSEDATAQLGSQIQQMTSELKGVIQDSNTSRDATIAQLGSQIQQIAESNNVKIDLLTSELNGVIQDLNTSRDATVQIKAEVVINISTLRNEIEILKNQLINEIQTVQKLQEFQNAYIRKFSKLAHPLRKINQLFKSFHTSCAQLYDKKLKQLKRLLHPYLIKAMLLIKQRPKLFQNVMSILDLFPRVKNRLHLIYVRQCTLIYVDLPLSMSQKSECNETTGLSSYANRLYMKLKSEVMK